ncbi:MAG: hypothetical protein WCA97_15150, partial [Terriglobales bacterium]
TKLSKTDQPENNDHAIIEPRNKGTRRKTIREPGRDPAPESHPPDTHPGHRRPSAKLPAEPPPTIRHKAPNPGHHSVQKRWTPSHFWDKLQEEESPTGHFHRHQPVANTATTEPQAKGA